MQIIKIAPLSNGAHDNQTVHGVTPESFPIPEGWAVVPEGMEPENFPFGEVEAAEIDGVMTVTKWTPGIMPEPVPLPEPEPVPSTQDEIRALREELLTTQLAMCEYIEMKEGEPA